MMHPIYTSKNYDPARITSRYVTHEQDGAFWFCECAGGERRVDVRQGYVDREDLPPNVVLEAIARRAAGVWPFAIEWPL